MRRRALAAFLFVLTTTALLPTPPARAQAPPTVTLRLLGQSPWNAPDRPLELTFEATSESDVALENLSVVLSALPPASGRIQYE